MIELALVWLLALAWLAWLIHEAPDGWEDNNGFHYGREDDQ